MAGEDSLALLARALSQTRAIISQIRPDQENLPTPCTEWDVRALANHTVFDALAFTASVSGGSDLRLTRTSSVRTGQTPTVRPRTGCWPPGASAAQTAHCCS